MINIELYHNPHLEPNEPKDIDIELALKNYLLFSIVDEEVVATTSKEHLNKAMFFYTKLDSEYRLIILDDDSYERLYNRFLGLKSDKAITNLHQNKQIKDITIDEELSLNELLKISSDILTSEESAPIIKFTNAMFYQAIKQGATDIHIETYENRADIRYRVDGVLNKSIELNKKIAELIISRIKVISNLDISEKRLPQDGRTHININGKKLDIRVSVIPVFHSERVVLRILMQSDQVPSIEELEFDQSTTDNIKRLLTNPHGIILVTGPTGSGKTTSLHAFLKEVYSPEKNIITVEDPVEYKSEIISQMQVNEKIDLTFAKALRSILRQDPDVIMIGEIRDEETASIATRAALTGHLVFSTLHTNSASATISRLIDMKIEPFLISSSLLGIVAQRLVRVLCDECKEHAYLNENLAHDLNTNKKKIYKQSGCKKCNYSGYQGRIAIAEMMIMDDDIRGLIKENSDEFIIREHLNNKGVQSISTQLKHLLLDGKISLDEALRVGLSNA